MSDDAPEKQESSGAPAWVMTFADLMSLLMCFFVLLLSFSEMDLQKYKQVAGSMDRAFGVQREIKLSETPRGTSIILQEFSPGKPEPTVLNEIRQQAEESPVEELKIEQEETTQAEADATRITETMVEEIADGSVEVETKENKIVVRILEKGSFTSGSATIRDSFLPVITKISEVISTIPGYITVAGFTDDVPISTDRFRSNWELSSARSVSVVEKLLLNKKLYSFRFVVSGFADNNPLVPNNSKENRAKNRRVELIIEQGEKYDSHKRSIVELESNIADSDKDIESEDQLVVIEEAHEEEEFFDESLAEIIEQEPEDVIEDLSSEDIVTIDEVPDTPEISGDETGITENVDTSELPSTQNEINEVQDEIATNAADKLERAREEADSNEPGVDVLIEIGDITAEDVIEKRKNGEAK